MTDAPYNTVTPPPQGWWADAPKPATPTSPFWQEGPKTAAAAQPSEFWKPAAAIGQGGTPEQARAMAEELVRSGAMTKDAADAGLRAGGNDPAPADACTDAQKDFDATFTPPPAPEYYRLDYINRLPPGTDVSTVSLFNGAATQWLHGVQMPAVVGTGLVERAMEIGQQTASMSGPALELFKREQAAAFDRMAKTPERAAQLRAYAAEVLAMPTNSPEFSNGLLTSGARFDATVLMNLALHGERLAARRAMS